MAGSLSQVMYWAVRTTLCSALRSDAEQFPGDDVTSQDALDGTAVEVFEDLRTHAKALKSPKGK